MFTFYWPSLFYLPILLIVGVVFLVVPGGFMIVGGAVYCAAASFTGYVAMAARRRRGPRATSRRPSRLRPTAGRPRRSGADIATPIAAALNTDQGVIR